MRTVTALVFDGFQVPDMMGPLEFFGNLHDEFSIWLVAEHGGPVTSRSNAQDVAPLCLDETADDIGILLIPGGQGTRCEINNPALIDWIGRAAERAEIVASVCTGEALLAANGHLDGRRTTTNKIAFNQVAQGRPQDSRQKRARWVKDGKYFTSSGVSAGMDMPLAILETLLGASKAKEVAGWAEYTWNSDPDNDPFAIT